MDGWMGRIAVVFGRVGYREVSLVVVVVVVEIMENHQLCSVVVVVKVSGWVRHVEVCRDLVERDITTLMYSLGQVEVS